MRPWRDGAEDGATGRKPTRGRSSRRSRAAGLKLKYIVGRIEITLAEAFAQVSRRPSHGSSRCKANNAADLSCRPGLLLACRILELCCGPRSVTKSAASRLGTLMARHSDPNTIGVRVGLRQCLYDGSPKVQPQHLCRQRGCNGMSYTMDLVSAVAAVVDPADVCFTLARIIRIRSTSLTRPASNSRSIQTQDLCR